MPSLLKSGGLKFGGQDYIQVPYTTLHAPISAITVESWAYSPNWQSNVGQRILSKTEGGGYNLALNDTGVGLSFTLLLNGSYYSALLSSTSISTGWHHIIGTCDGRYVNLYIDGVLVKSTDTGAYKNIGYTNNNNLCIGTEAGNTVATNSQNFVGTIGATRIYNRALSPTEVYNNYQGNVTRSGLVGEWLLNATSGTVAKDTSGNGNDGTLNGCAWANHTVKQKPKKNMIPSLNSGQWTINSNLTVKGDYSATLNATSGFQNSYIDIPINPSTVYSLSAQVVASSVNAWVDIEWRRSDKSVISSSVGRVTFSTSSFSEQAPSDAKFARVNMVSSVTGTFTYTNPQLELGSTATAFEPYTLVPDLVGGVTQRPVTSTKKAVKYSNQVDYQFSRASIEPYNGLYFPNDTPRVDSNGVIVEEGTTNILLNPSFKDTSVWVCNTDGAGQFTASNGWGKITKGTGTYTFIRQTIASTNGTYSITLKNNAVGQCGIRTGTKITTITLDGSGIPIRVSLSDTTALVDVILGSTYGHNPVAPFVEFTSAQFEAKAYATSFTDNPLGRQAETLTFPTANVLNASAGTIESWILPAPKATGTSEVWWTVLHSDGWGWVGINSNGISVGSSDLSATTIVDRTKPIHIVQTWNGSVIKVYANGVLLGSGSGTITLLPTIYLGVWYNGVSYRGNMAIKSLRISNIARTDADIANSYNQSIANNNKLAMDDSTTKLLNF